MFENALLTSAKRVSLATITRLTLMKCEPQADGISMHVHHPGFTFEMMNNSGKMNLWDLHLYCVYSRQAAFRATISDADHFFPQYVKATQNVYTYVASLQTEISKSFYDIMLRPSITPLRLVLYPGYIGKSSYNTVVEIHDANSGELFVRNTNQLVTVDKEKRKPVPLQQWFREKFADKLKGSSLIVRPFSVPSKHIQTHTTNIRVGYSDIDYYKHANFASYMKYSIEAAMEAANRGVYKGLFSGVLMNFKVKSIKMAFITDVTVEDELSVTTWQSPEHLQQIYTDIALKATKKTINQSVIEFHEN